MNKSLDVNISYCLSIALCFMLLGCQTSESDDVTDPVPITINLVNKAPLVSAGPDFEEYEGSTVTLFGEVSDTDGEILSTLWKQLEGLNVEINDVYSVNTTFIAPLLSLKETQILVFELTVTDNLNAVNTDLVSITINPTNESPLVNAGPDFEEYEGSTVNLFGEVSDTDGEILSTFWKQLEGINAEIQDASSVNTTFIAPLLSLKEAQILVFELTVTDNLDAVNTDLVSITIKPIGELPIAKAGEDQVLAPNSEVTLDCSQSYHPQGEQFSASWLQISGSSISLADNPSCLITFNLPNTAEVFEFALTVTDDKGQNSSDTISITSTPTKLPLLTINNLKYQGAFRLPTDTFGESSLNYASAVMTYNDINHSLFIVGHDREQGVAEFLIPEVVNSTNVDELYIADAPKQGFTTILNRTEDGNPDNLDKITGMSLIDNKLVVNAVTYYDAAADNKNTTLIVEEPLNLLTSEISGYYSVQGAAHAAGWISDIPQEWRLFLGEKLMGYASNGPINTRWSIGPSAFLFKFEDIISNLDKEIPTTSILDFSIATPLHTDRFNDIGDNNLWTHMSRGQYGFVVPNTKTYAVFGSSGGHNSGIGYKITQNNGNKCGGYCPYDENDDNEAYYWLWNVSDLIAVKRGEKKPSDILPYEYGVFPVPFQKNEWEGVNENHGIAGGSYDAKTGKLYLSLSKADRNSKYTNAPIIITFDIVPD